MPNKDRFLITGEALSRVSQTIVYCIEFSLFFSNTSLSFSFLFEIISQWARIRTVLAEINDRQIGGAGVILLTTYCRSLFLFLFRKESQ